MLFILYWYYMDDIVVMMKATFHNNKIQKYGITICLVSSSVLLLTIHCYKYIRLLFDCKVLRIGIWITILVRFLFLFSSFNEMNLQNVDEIKFFDCSITIRDPTGTMLI